MMIDAQGIRWRQERYKLSLASGWNSYAEGCLQRGTDGILDKIHPSCGVRPIGTHGLQRCVTQQHRLLRNGIAAITFPIDKLDTVIGDTAKNGVVTIDFSVLKKVDTVKLPSNVVKQIAKAANDPADDAKSLEIVLTNGTSVKLNAKVLDEKNVQANGADITLSIKRITDRSLNIKQRLTVGNRPALDINITLGGKPISNIIGRVTVSASYELKPGEHVSGIIVSYVDANGNRQLCETSYDPVKKQVSWKTGPLSPSSIYMIGYDESRVKPGTGSYVTYTVQKGSTLSMIARRYGCTVAEILAVNSGLIKNPNRIYVGWQLKIPQD